MNKPSKFILCFILHLFVFYFQISIASATEVSGHISQDTTWSPGNNPYIVVDNIWVDQNVTLRILPGTIVKFETSTYPTGGDYFYGDGYSEAKFMKVSGRIIAAGTVQDSIVFTKNCDATDRRWGVIILDYLSDDDSIFDHCRIEYSFKMQLIMGGEYYIGAISLSNARATIRNCFFKNYYSGIQGFYDSSPWIYKNYFICNDENAQNYTRSAINFEDNIGTKPYISYNTFMNYSGIKLWEVNTSLNATITYNTFINSLTGINCKSPGCIYKNYFFNCQKAMDIDNYYTVVSQNVIDSCGIGIEANFRYSIINNIVLNCNTGMILQSWYTPESNLVINNFILNNLPWSNLSWGIKNSYTNSIFSNNVIIGIEKGIYATGGSDYTTYILNNVIASCEEGLRIYSNCEVFNNIIYDIEDYSINASIPNTTINSGNNCFSAPLYLNTVIYNDLGGNIEDDPLFLDPVNGNYHLSGNSPCIDTGLEDITPFNLPVYDLDFNDRIWDGDNNGIARIDMGCYEYLSQPAMGGIEGYITQDYITNFLPFTEIDVSGTLAFPDTNGYYEMKLFPGTYELNADLEFYEEVSIPNITVIAGEYTQVDFEMISLLDVQKHEIPASSSLISHLSNYPNPFNPETKISFSVTQSSAFATIEIFNIKGQKVKTLMECQVSAGDFNCIWKGRDDNGKRVSSGTYIARLKIDGKEQATCKIMLLK
ncbi:MAG TPA: FlgD immunoglobulin-like domain containing protein [Candidatus Cloacimonadota bacterium]|nr:FlgD immunoglobulin-like domain containing protein [Candidatus Cloacimonadota bacterium]